MKIAVLGSKGMLGHILTAYLINKTKHEVYGFSRKGDMDLTSMEALTNIYDKFNPDVIINCIGVLVKDSQGYKN